MPPFTLPDLAEAVLRFARDTLAGCQVVRVEIYLKGEEQPFHIPAALLNPNQHAPAVRPVEPVAAAPTSVAPAAPAIVAALDAPAEEEKSSNRHPMLHRCVKEILATLRQANRPLTKTRLLEEMAHHSYDWSESTVVHYLKMLMDDGTICNPPDARPRGYRLSE